MFSGVEEALSIIARCEREYPESALFLFFKGRALRLQVSREGEMEGQRGC